MFASSLAIVRAYFAVCTFRLGPQDLPAAGVFLSISLALYALASTALVLPARALPVAILSGTTETALLLLITWVLLRLRGVPARFRQTATALTGTGFLFSLVALPLFCLHGVDAAPLLLALIGLLVLCLVVWNVAVMAHILRHALSASFPMGVLLAMGYIWLITMGMSAILPGQAGR